jgi:hypothetical protein
MPFVEASVAQQAGVAHEGTMPAPFSRAAALAPLVFALLAPVVAPAQPAARSTPMTASLPPTIPAAADVPYPGTMALEIDATDVERGIYRVTQTIPVKPGATRLTLFLPQWIPGHHGPVGRADQIADVRFFAGTQLLVWRRDPIETFAFHVDVPAGTAAVTARFVHTSPLTGSEGRITMTPQMLNLQWDEMSLYPAGHYVRQIRVRPAVSFPAGWRVFTALDGQQPSTGSAPGNRVTWAETDYETLVDSPIFAGRHAARWDLGSTVSLNAVADEPGLLALRPEHLATYRALVAETLALYGNRPFDRYDFLVAMTNRLGSIGLEHHRSSENQMEPATWTEWEAMGFDRNILPHELSHSWDGKFRRPAKLWTPDYRQPMQDNLLWVYEGQNQFWGYILAARSGVQSKEMVLAMIASDAGEYTQQPGRGWRSVEDTTHDPVFAQRRPKPYGSLTRGEEYYTEGALVWLEADQLIRAGSGGSKSLDDFARAFFSPREGDWGVVTYEFGDVVRGLNAVYPYDWASFLKARIEQSDLPAPLAGIERGGYRLVWKEEPNLYDRGRMAYVKNLSLYHSLGVGIDKDGRVTSSRWESPAFNAGIVTGAKIIAVNGIAYDAANMRDAITAAKTSKDPIQLIIQRGDRFLTVAVDYHGGLRYPWLERAAGAGPVGLDLLLAPRRGRTAGGPAPRPNRP